MSNGTMQLKFALKAASVRMKYEDGGKVQVVTVNETEYRFPGHMRTDQIIESIRAGTNG